MIIYQSIYNVCYQCFYDFLENMILYFDSVEARESAMSVYKAPGNINTKLIISASCGAFWRLVCGLSAFILL